MAWQETGGRDEVEERTAWPRLGMQAESRGQLDEGADRLS